MISEEFSLPFLNEGLTKTFRARSELDKTEGKSNDVVKEAVRNYVNAGRRWLLQRREAQTSLKAFVVDRFAVDMLALWILARVNAHDDDWLRKVIEEVQQQSASIDLIIIPALGSYSLNSVNEWGLKRAGALRTRLLYHSLVIGLCNQLLETPKLFLPAGASLEEAMTVVRLAVTADGGRPLFLRSSAGPPFVVQ
jgi:hypothetical protein